MKAEAAQKRPLQFPQHLRHTEKKAPALPRWQIWIAPHCCTTYIGRLNRWELFCLIILCRWRVKRTE